MLGCCIAVCLIRSKGIGSRHNGTGSFFAHLHLGGLYMNDDDGRDGTEPRRHVAGTIGHDLLSVGRDPVNNPGGACG
jgi:hypothetical protein